MTVWLEVVLMAEVVLTIAVSVWGARRLLGL
jgi:hypothetical protein